MEKLKQGFLKLGPKTSLTLLVFVNFLIYLDRGAIAGVLGEIQSSLELNTIQSGALGSIFMFGYIIGSPIMAHMAQFIHPLHLMCIGMIIWTVSVSMCGFSTNFWMLLIFRSFTGIGEASFVSLAPPFIVDLAPSNLKSMWLAFFYSAIFLGTAGGYIYSTLISSALGGWQYPFFIEGLLMCPLILLVILAYKDPKMLVRKRDILEEEGEITSFNDQIKQLLKNPVFVFLVLGFSAYSFTGGALGYWGPYAIHILYDESPEDAALMLGAITISCGFIATLIGALILDKTTRKYILMKESEEISAEKLEKFRTEKACLILFISMIIGTTFGVAGICLEDLVSFLIGLAVAEFFIFVGTGPIGMALMGCVSEELRGEANAVAIFVMHLLGDFPSPLVIGLLIYYVGVFWGILVCTVWLSWCVILWGAAWNTARFHGKDFEVVMKNFFKKSEIEKPENKGLIN